MIYGPRANLFGRLWMVLAILCFAIEDTLLKTAAAQLPVAQVLVGFDCQGIWFFSVTARLQGASLWSVETRAPAMKIRMGFEVFGRLFFGVALTVAPLSVVIVILQETPLVVVTCAAFIFGERVGVLRGAAILLGFVGGGLQPGAESFSWSAFLAVLGMLGFAGRDLASRVA